MALGLVGSKQLARLTRAPFEGVPWTVAQRFRLPFHLICALGPEGPLDGVLEGMLDVLLGGGPPPPTYQTVPVQRRSLQLKLTLICVTRSTLVGLRTIVAFIETLVTSGDRNSVVSGQIPSATNQRRVFLQIRLTFAGSSPGTRSTLWRAHCYGGLCLILGKRQHNSDGDDSPEDLPASSA